jgi:mono/diheme cytochrome c family protein
MELVRTLSHPNGWWRDTAQHLLVERGEKSVVPSLRQLARKALDYRTRLHALWTLDGLDAIDVATVQRALGDKSPEVRASAVRLSERWLRQPNHPLQAVVVGKLDDPNWFVRRQVAASAGELPQPARFDALATVLSRFPDDPISVDAAASGLAGQEGSMLDRLLKGQDSPRYSDAITVLAGALARGRNAAAVARVFDAAADSGRPMWQRLALLRGAGIGLESGGRGAGQGAGGGRAGAGGARGGSVALSLAQEPSKLARLAAGSDDLAQAAKAVLARVDWPGKPAPVNVAPQLTPEQQKRFDDGEQLYRNICSGCHQPDGQGREQLAPSLVNSPLVTADPGIGARILLAGKEGKIGLMPPQGVLSDEQIADVLTYIRREWGHTASAVAPEDVKEVRGLTSTHTQPWTDEELARLTAGRGGRGGE